MARGLAFKQQGPRCDALACAAHGTVSSFTKFKPRPDESFDLKRSVASAVEFARVNRKEIEKLLGMSCDFDQAMRLIRLKVMAENCGCSIPTEHLRLITSDNAREIEKFFASYDYEKAKAADAARMLALKMKMESPKARQKKNWKERQ